MPNFHIAKPKKLSFSSDLVLEYIDRILYDEVSEVNEEWELDYDPSLDRELQLVLDKIIDSNLEKNTIYTMSEQVDCTTLWGNIKIKYYRGI